MTAGESISQWISGLRSGAPTAVQKLWRRYRRRMLGLARRRLHGGGRGAADEEDVVSAAFHSFCRRMAGQGFPQMRDRDDLWRVLALIVSRKAINQRRDLLRHDSACQAGADQAAARELGPEELVISAEELLARLGQLADDQLRLIATMKLDGHTNVEIAAELGRSVPTIERRLRLIRNTWQQDT